jgi:carboxypeptidase family protein
MGKLAGQVLGEDGKPAAKARVYCQSSDGRSPRATKTDAQGHFQLTCPSGPVDVRAHAGENWSEWTRNVRIRTGEVTSITIHITAPSESGQAKKDKPGTPQK